MKAQIEITNTIFMHLMGIIGILVFTFLYISLLSSSSTRAESLSEETLYYNYARRLISASDCLAYKEDEVYYNNLGFKSISRVHPGIVDMSKFFDYSHRNCLRYDLVSGSAHGDPSDPFAPYPVLIYQVSAYDLVENKTYNFTNSVYETISQGKVYDICDPASCRKDCLYDCNELLAYKNGYYASTKGTSLECRTKYYPHGLPSPSEVEVKPRYNCWTRGLNDISRVVRPFNGSFNCSIPSSLIMTGSKVGKVFQTSLNYPVVLRNITSPDSFTDHPGLIKIKFCVIKIPTMCDPFFNGYTFGKMDLLVYNPDECKRRGLPLI